MYSFMLLLINTICGGRVGEKKGRAKITNQVGPLGTKFGKANSRTLYIFRT
jgi:hypothetical protein